MVLFCNADCAFLLDIMVYHMTKERVKLVIYVNWSRNFILKNSKKSYKSHILAFYSEKKRQHSLLYKNLFRVFSFEIVFQNILNI